MSDHEAANESTASETTGIKFSLNGRPCGDRVPTNTMLMTLLRERHGLQGVRASCERGVCGACTVLIDDEPVASCSAFAFEVDGTRVETVEGQCSGGRPGPVQRAFIERGGFQCGFCTSGMVVLTTALLRTDPEPSPQVVREWISSNICRCTGYRTILESVARAGELLAADDAAPEPEED
jgi:carbon-monoxide dehydrogenase small subunit